MPLEILIFGQLSDITGSSKLQLDEVMDTNSLIEVLNKKYPALMKANYMIAVDKKMITDNTLLSDQSTVALMPPFSGG